MTNGKLDLHSISQSTGHGVPSGYDWDPLFKERFPTFVEWVHELPFAKLDSMVFVTQTDDVRDHMDIFGHNNSMTCFQQQASIEPRNTKCGKH